MSFLIHVVYFVIDFTIMIVSFAIALTIKIIAVKLLYKRFGIKFIKFFNISISIIAVLVMMYFMVIYIYIYNYKPPVYHVMYGSTLALLCCIKPDNVWWNFRSLK